MTWQLCCMACPKIGDDIIARNGKTVNTLRPRQNGLLFADDTFKRIFLNQNARISIKISLRFVPKGPINNNSALVQIVAWRRSGDKPLSEPRMVSLLTHICVTRPQWVKRIFHQILIVMVKSSVIWKQILTDRLRDGLAWNEWMEGGMDGKTDRWKDRIMVVLSQAEGNKNIDEKFIFDVKNC